MVVNVGKRIIIEACRYKIRRDADTPGLVSVEDTRDGKTINLPGNTEEAERFIEAYRRCVAEDIKYRETKVE